MPVRRKKEFPEASTSAPVMNLNIRGANVRRTDFNFANLERANSSHADCSFAVFRGANMKDTILKGTILKGADLTDVRNLTLDQLKEAVIDGETILPEYLAGQFSLSRSP